MPRKRTGTVTPEAFARAASKAVLNGTPLAGQNDISELSRTSRAAIVNAIGPDVETFRAHLADKLIVIASELADAIRRDIDEMPPASRAFALCAVTDKSELLRSRIATSAAGARVNVQINAFGDGAFDRNALLASLAGQLPAMPAQAPQLAAPDARTTLNVTQPANPTVSVGINAATEDAGNETETIRDSTDRAPVDPAPSTPAASATHPGAACTVTEAHGRQDVGST